MSEVRDDSLPVVDAVPFMKMWTSCLAEHSPEKDEKTEQQHSLTRRILEHLKQKWTGKKIQVVGEPTSSSKMTVSTTFHVVDIFPLTGHLFMRSGDTWTCLQYDEHQHYFIFAGGAHAGFQRGAMVNIRSFVPEWGLVMKETKAQHEKSLERAVKMLHAAAASLQFPRYVGVTVSSTPARTTRLAVQASVSGCAPRKNKVHSDTDDEEDDSDDDDDSESNTSGDEDDDDDKEKKGSKEKDEPEIWNEIVATVSVLEEGLGQFNQRQQLSEHLGQCLQKCWTDEEVLPIYKDLDEIVLHIAGCTRVQPYVWIVQLQVVLRWRPSGIKQATNVGFFEEKTRTKKKTANSTRKPKKGRKATREEMDLGEGDLDPYEEEKRDLQERAMRFRERLAQQEQVQMNAAKTKQKKLAKKKKTKNKKSKTKKPEKEKAIEKESEEDSDASDMKIVE